MTPFEAEKAILGALMLDESAFAETQELEASDFALDSHRRIFTLIATMRAAQMEVDQVTVLQELMTRKELETIGGSGYLVGLTDGAVRGMSVRTYVRQVKSASAGRRVVALCEAARAQVEAGDDPVEVLANLQSHGNAVQLASADLRPAPIAEWAMSTLGQLKHESEHTGRTLGVPSGIAELDAVTTGWRAGELTYIGAAPGRGKTALLLQSAYAAVRAGYGVGIVSLEMRKEALMRRLAVMHSGIASTKIRDPRLLTKEEYRTVERAILELGGFPIQGTDVSGLNAAQITRCCRQMCAQGAEVIFIDFVQLARSEGRDPREAINRVSAAIRDCAKDLNVPIVCASQLARRDGDPNRKPVMSDLRESGNLEQDAHRVLLLYRPVARDTGEFTGEDEILVAKQREGVLGPVHVRYDDQRLQFFPRYEGPRAVERAA